MSEHLIRYYRYLSAAKKLRSQSAELQARALDQEANADAAYADHLQDLGMRDIVPPGFTRETWAAAERHAERLAQAEEAARRG